MRVSSQETLIQNLAGQLHSDYMNSQATFSKTHLIFSSSSGLAQIRSKSPDTITSWVLSGFAVSNETGFGVANEKPQV